MRRQETSPHALTTGRIARFWLPLQATWLMMAAEGPFLAAVIARLPVPKENLAAFAVASALYQSQENLKMEEQILIEILQEMKGMRAELGETNSRLRSLEETTNRRFESLEQTTNNRFESLEQKFAGVASSVQVLTQGFSDVRYELVEIKRLLGTRVIWNNDNVAFQVREGETLYGIIRKEEKKE